MTPSISIHLIERVAELICRHHGREYVARSWRAHWCAKAWDLIWEVEAGK